MDYGALIQLIMAGVGEAGAQVDERQARAILEKSMREYGKIDLPTLQKITAEELGPSAMESVKSDPEYGNLQRQSLDELLRIGRSGGMTLEDTANLNTIRGQQARASKANEGRVREQMAARGIRGGGAELAMQLSGNQAAAQRASEEGLRVAADAQRRGLDAILEGGRMAGNIRSQDFGEKSQRASAADERARYNADARARAQAYNAGLSQQNFENNMALTGARTGRADALSGFYGTQAASTRAAARGIGQAAANYGTKKKKSLYEDEE